MPSSQGTARPWIHRQRRAVALNGLSGVAGSVVLHGAGQPALGLSLPPSEAPRAHKGSEQLPWGAAPAGMGQCRVQSQFWLNQTPTIAGAGWFPILGLTPLIPAPKVRMCCFCRDNPSLKLHPWDGLWDKAAAHEQRPEK